MQTFTLPAGRKDALRAAQVIQALPTDKGWTVEIREFKPKRSDQANRYLRGVVYPQFLAGGGEALRGWTAADLHEFLLGEHFGWEILEGFGRKRVKPVRRSAKLNAKEFSEFVDFILLKAANMGIYIESANEGLLK
jgi:hypothetical protein